MSQEFMFASDFLYANKNVTATALDGLGTAYYAPGIGEVYARSGWDKHATWVNLIAGPYTQSHAHQDQGSLMIYKDGWLAYDVVVDSHSGLTQDTTAHSLVRIIDTKGKTVEQQANYDLSKPDSKVVALHRGTLGGIQYLHVAADLTAAYGGQAIVQQVQREIVYLEPSTVIVYDRLNTTGGQLVFQLVSPVSTPNNDPTGTTHTFTANGHTLRLEDVGPVLGMQQIIDFKKADATEFMGGFRLEEPALASNNIRFLHVLTIDGAADPIAQGSTADIVTLTLHPSNTAVSMEFAHGDPVNNTAVGGKLTIGNQSITLGAVVDSLPE
jgi:hypothetical protein